MFQNPPFRTYTVPNFYPRAAEMRQRFDAFFTNPGQHNEQHQCWDIWYVPRHYYYFRAQPARIFERELYDDFRSHLANFAQSIGMTQVTGDFLSLYTNGCHQNTHSDMLNGSLAWVFSLTNWDSRKFTGGETFVAKEGVFDRLEPRQHMGNASYWEVIEPKFNQLVLFDDRVAHMVPTILGPIDPVEGRVVQHGHMF